MDKSSEKNNQIKEGQKNSFSRRLWEGWKRIARKIGDFNARVILSLFYVLLLSPFALAVKIFTDPLKIKGKVKQGWVVKDNEESATRLEQATRQF